ncbi:MAG: SusC/RagA family TonB-linked outer membrane protein [Chitinophagaceae bacterium]|nr:SusC/RagA family TonB-linked outer membrane protein [Chitinophagaceae bacterium]
MNCLRLPKLLLLSLTVCFSFFAMAQERTISGKVTDQETKAPLEGVTVRVKNTQTATTTNAAGDFTIKVPSSESVITFSYVGYGIYEIKAGTGAVLAIPLFKLDNKLEDVVVVGYGTKKRVNVQGSVATVKAAEIADLPVANLGTALINRVPGVSVSFASGKPGSTTDINIRNSITFPGTSSGAANQPLYVIDGIIVNPTLYNQVTNPEFFENLDASQIEDITFLKDASAAIYGAAGAKGVVLITTKKGKAGKPRISYNGYLGRSDEAVKTKTLTAYQHAKMLNDGYELNNTAVASRFSQADLDRLRSMPDRSWYDDIWKAGQVTRHTINVTGGSERATFFAGGSYYKEDGNYGGITVDKYSIRSGMDAKIIDGLTANISFSSDFNHEERGTLKGANGETDDLSIRAMYLTPKWVPISINGQPTWFNGPNPPGNWSMLGLFNSGNYTRDRSQGLSVNASLEYKPTFVKGLTAKIQFGKLNRNSTSKQYYPSYRVANFVRNGNNGLLYSDSINATTPWTTITNNNQISEGTTTSSSYQLIGTLSYARKIGQHEFSALVGMDQGESESRNIFLSKFQQLVAGVDEFWAFSNDPTSIASITDAIRNPQGIQFAKRSYVSRADYSFRGKYFFEFIGRADASSNFAPDNRWGFFPTVGLGWRISDEDFFRNNIHFVNNLKIRANYGMVGEDRVTNKTYVSRFTQTTGYLFGNVFTNGLDPNLYPNPAATWEKSRTLNVGFDASLLNNKINITADFYQRYTYDAFNQLDASALPLTTGLLTAVVNYGEALAWGSEFTVGYRTNFGRDWTFNADVNFGWSNSMILRQYYSPVNFGLFGQNGISNPIGKDPRKYNGNNYGYIATGILRSQEEVDALLAKYPNYTIGGQKPQAGFMNYQDVNNDGKIDDNDVTLMFNRTTPLVVFGMTFTVTYKDFRLQTNMNLSIGGKRFYDSEARKVPTTTQNAPAFWSDYWTPDNPNAKFPRADAPLARETSTFWAVNGTQSRINNMVLSYQMPKRISSKFKIPDFRVLVTGTNLWSIINPLKYKDPYTGNFANYPTLRTLSVGINVSL